jgi:UDP-N-acetylmuramate--alanine ligase
MTSRYHFIGIGGIGMSALAQILLARGRAVSGSDLTESEMTTRLSSLGARVSIGHRAENVEGAGRVIVSDAIHQDNPELARARQLGLRIQKRSELLGELMAESRGLAVSGTHGKTTVTAMIGLVLVEAGLDPTIVLGGEHDAIGGNARAGGGDWFVAEACEAYESFLDLRPEVAVVTNIEPDHLDHHGTVEHLRQSFARFLDRVQPGGAIVLCADRPELRSLPLPRLRRVVWYGADESARAGRAGPCQPAEGAGALPESSAPYTSQVQGVGIETAGGAGRCRLLVDGREVGVLTIATPGAHNVVNALGAVAAALAAEVPVATCLRALAGFSGVGRRFEVLGAARGVTVVDDYAHHPTELRATIAAARSAFPGRRLVAVFQPHLYSRTRDFAEGFAEALREADLAVLAEIYPAREAPIPGVDSGLIADHLRGLAGEDAVIEMAKEQVAIRLPAFLHSGDVVLCMGAGDIGRAARDLVRRLGACPAGEHQVLAKQ